MGAAGRFISPTVAGRLVRLPGWGVAMLADLVSHDPYSPYGSSFASAAYKICVQKVKRELSSGNRYRLRPADINFSVGAPPGRRVTDRLDLHTERVFARSFEFAVLKILRQPSFRCGATELSPIRGAVTVKGAKDRS